MAGTRPVNEADELTTLTGGEEFLALSSADGLVTVPASVLRAYIAGVAAAPTDILLNGQSAGTGPDGAFEVSEGQAVGTALFTLTSVDPGETGTPTFSIVSGNDAGLFAINGDKLEVADDIDATAVSSVTLGLQVTDSDGFQMAAPKSVTLLIRLVPAALPVLQTAAVLPSIPPAVGVEFRATAPVFTADAADTIYEHQWMIDLTTEIVGATGLAYIPEEAEVGRRYRLRTRARARGRPVVEVFSAESQPVVQGSGPTITSLVASDPTATTVVLRHPAQPDAVRYQYRWRVGTLNYGSPVFLDTVPFDALGTIRETLVTGLTESTLYTFQVRWQRPDGTYSAWNDPGTVSNQIGTTALTAPPSSVPTLITAPTTTFSTAGAPRPGTVMGGSNGVWDNNPSAQSFTYRYLRVDGAGAETVISGATGAAYTIVTADVGFRLIREVTASNSVGAGTPHKSTPSEVVQPAPTTSTPSGAFQIELPPPNLDNPRTVSLGASTTGTRQISVSPLQDHIFTAPNPTVGRRGRDYITGGANAWVEGINFEMAMLQFLHFRGEKFIWRCEWDARFGPEADNLWIRTTIPADGLQPKVTRAASRIVAPPGTWFSHSSLYVTTASCSSAGLWTMTATAHRGVESAKLPQVGEVLEIVGGRNTAARGRWIRISTVSWTGGGGVDFVFTITGVDVTEGRPSTSPLAISTWDARTAYAVREFRCQAGVLTLQMAGMGTVLAGSQGRGFILNQVWLNESTKFYRANTVYHITAWDAETQTATLQLRLGDSAVTGQNFVIPGSRVKAAYYDSRHLKPFDTTLHSDTLQLHPESNPVELRELLLRRIFAYQVRMTSGRASLYREWNCETSRVDTYDMPEIFPVMLQSNGLDMQTYGSTLGNISEFAGNTRWAPDPWRSLAESQVAEPAMPFTDGTQTAVGYPAGSGAAIGVTGSILVWTDVENEVIGPGEALTHPWTFAFAEADAAPSGIQWRLLTTADVRNAAANTPLAERLRIIAPRRGLIHTVTLVDTAGGRFQTHTVDGGPSRCIAKGATALAASTTYNPVIRIVTSSPLAGHTTGFTTDFNLTITTNSAGGIASISAALA